MARIESLWIELDETVDAFEVAFARDGCADIHRVGTRIGSYEQPQIVPPKAESPP